MMKDEEDHDKFQKSSELKDKVNLLLQKFNVNGDDEFEKKI